MIRYKESIEAVAHIFICASFGHSTSSYALPGVFVCKNQLLVVKVNGVIYANRITSKCSATH